MKVTIDVPDELLDGSNFPPEDVARQVLLATAIHWWTQAWISQGYAADWVGMNRVEFMQLLSARKISVILWDEEEFEREFAYVRSSADRERLANHLSEPAGIAGNP